jgi:hypothetical protein
MTLAATVRSHLHALGVAALRAGFVGRLRSDVKIVVERWSAPRTDAASSVAARAELQAFAQTLSGAADVLGFDDLRRLADTLAEATTSPVIAPGKVDQALAALVAAAEDI